MKILNQVFFLIAFVSLFFTFSLNSEAYTSSGNLKQVKTHTTTEPHITAGAALSRLKIGNKSYMSGDIRKEGQSQKDRARLVSSQNPHTIVFSCSDSRVPPEIIFDQKLGELFVVRTAGEAIDNMAIASIEYAVEHFGSQLLLILGHESCGAVTTAFENFNNKDVGSPALNELVKDIQPHIKKFSGKQHSYDYISEVKANTLGVANDLVARSNIISEKTKKNQLKIQTAIYHLSSGLVEFYSDLPSVNLTERP